MQRTLISKIFGHAVAIGCAISLAGCVDAEGNDAEVLDEESLGSTEQAVVSGWTGYTSDEYPPITCDGTSLFNGIRITGQYADNISAYCYPTNHVKADSYWTPYFSEEYRGMMYCNSGYWITGLTCRGPYCDDVSVQCTRIPNSHQVRTRGTWPISEENGRLSFFPDEYAVGAMCTGKYCDNLKFAVARVGFFPVDHTGELAPR